MTQREIKFILFFLGLINNTPQVLVHGVSKKLSEELKRENMMPVFSGAMISLTFVSSVFYGRYLVKTHHMKRIILSIFLAVLGAALVILSLILEEIIVCFVGVSFIGIAKLFGLLTIMGFVKSFDSSAIGGLTAGTGGAGLFGALYIIAMRYWNKGTIFTFLTITIAYVPYFFLFAFLIKLLYKY